MFKFGNHAKKVSVDPLAAYRDPTVGASGKSPVVARVINRTADAKSKNKITADMYSGSGTGGNAGSNSSGTTSSGVGTYNASGVSGYSHDQYNVVWDKLDEGSVIEGWIPRDAAGLDMLYRRIALRDPTLGPGIDLLKNLPWSDYILEGIDDPEIKRVYEDCMDLLQVPMLMPEVTGDYLTIGRNIISLAFDERKGIFSGVLPHDPDFIKITPIPIYGYDPLCDLKLTPGFKKFLTSDDARMIDARKSLPPDFVKAAKEDSGFLPLDPTSTIYLGRTASQSDYVGTSILTRALYFWGIEKALLNAQLTSTRRRSRSLTHIKVGIEEKWEPDSDQIDAITAMFMQANEDPVGAIIATRNGVEVTEPQGAGQDFYKWSDELELFSKYKMQVLGISDALLSGDATYSNSESARTVFVELLANLRFRITQRFFYVKLFPTLARLHGFVKRSQAELNHNIRVGATVNASVPIWAQTGNMILSNKLSSRERKNIPTNQLIMPRIEWLKQLRPSQDSEALQTLGLLQDAGYPVTLAKWASVAGYTSENLEEELKENQKLKALIAKYEDVPPADDSAGDDFGGDEGDGGEAPVGDSDFSDGTEEAPIQQSLAAKAKEIKSGVVRNPGQIGIWKLNRCNQTRRVDAERVVASIAQDYDNTIFKNPKEVVKILASKFNGNEEKIFTTAYVMNRMGLTNIKIPAKHAAKIVEAAQKALASCKSLNSDKFLLALAKFEKEMKCLHYYAGGRLDVSEAVKVAMDNRPQGNLGPKTLSGMY